MNITYASNGILQIDNARITFRNFEGRREKYNNAGDRNFHLVIPNQEIAEQLIEDGWNVKIKPPRTDEDSAFITMKVKVKFNYRGPSVYLKSGERVVRLDEESIACLDKIDIESVDLDIRPYDWKDDDGEVGGRTAYLQSIYVTQVEDRFADRYLMN